MESLVGNGTNLYRRNGYLVRTPIIINLNPSDRAWYGCAGRYDSANWPTGGFIESLTYNNNIKVGADCIYVYQHPSNKMYWRQVTSAHDPETVWYQGAYSTTAGSVALGERSCEAYLQCGAYRFTIPSGLNSLAVTNVKVKFTNGGGVRCFGTAQAASPNNRALKGIMDFNQLYLPFYVTEFINNSTPLLMPQGIVAASRPCDSSIDILADNGECRGARLLWDRIASPSTDGGIPTLTTPTSKQYDMGGSTLNYVNQHRDFWIVPMIDTWYSSGTLGGYAPYFVDAQMLWACISLWGISVEVSLGGAD